MIVILLIFIYLWIFLHRIKNFSDIYKYVQ